MKNVGYRYLTCLCPVVIGKSISVSEYLHKFSTLKLSSLSCSSALTLVHIILIAFIVHVLLLQVLQIGSYCTCAGDARIKLFSLLFIYVTRPANIKHVST